MAMVDNMPAGWIFSAFSIGRNQLPYAALALLAGGNVRVGLEDNIWLDKGVLATNGDLVDPRPAVGRGDGHPHPRTPRRCARSSTCRSAGAELTIGTAAPCSAAASSAPAGSRA